MPNAKLKNYFHLHFLVFIAGFTAILGELISIGSIPLVWYRMVIATILMFLFIKISKINLKVKLSAIAKFSVAGVIIALHWITFFESINQANISIALAMFSSGAFFASLIEPIFYKRRVIWYEILFGIIVILGVWLITKTEFRYINGILLGISSALFSSLFAVINGKFVERYRPSVISFYEFISGIFCMTIALMFMGDGMNAAFFDLSFSDWKYLFILGSICTAYAFIAAVHVMKHISPYTVVLTYNLEPIYGIGLAIILFPEKEKMSLEFYIGALLIISTVIINGVLKNMSKTKKNV
ncbi:MAG: DMT family transporter [Bacteroidia bacterium]|nr:DMT family transporter [Bacteroidia bacterium]NND24651.1 DMT family transporter [Flavobacteriaceae bacterium]MBT8279011.1 DMT family transporter [Bacteroidia bacterium]NNK60349.1 DMT family transporter [Flavobacteriaceae bacterium]NNL31834.1 DMT family transporter [Flavobacteriaceae bacterium]